MPTRAERWHGGLLVAMAALIPIGEGLSMAALVGVLVLLVVRRREVQLRVLRESPTFGVVAGLGAWLAAGLLAIVLGGEGWQKPDEIGRWLPFLAIPAVALSAPMLPERTLRLAVRAFVAALAVACLFGLVQYAFNIRPGESISRVDSTIATQGRIPGRFGETVAGGFYYHRLKMAHVLVVGLALAASRQLFAALTLRRRLVEGALLALMGATFLLTYTRGALVALAVGGFACLPFLTRRVRLAAMLGLALAAGVVLAIPSVRARVMSIGSDQASAVRSLIWSQGVRIIADHPLGTGLGNYIVVVNRYYDAADPAFTVRTYPHNVFLTAWAEAGPVGLVGWVVAWLSLVVACGRALWRRKSPFGDDAVAAGVGLLGIVAMLFIGLTHDVLFHNAVAMAFSAMVGGVLAFLGRASASPA